MIWALIMEGKLRTRLRIIVLKLEFYSVIINRINGMNQWFPNN